MRSKLRALVVITGVVAGCDCLAATVEGRLRLQQLQQEPSASNKLQHRFLLKQQLELSSSTSGLAEIIHASDTSQHHADFSPEHNKVDIHQLSVSKHWQQQAVTLGRQVWSVGSQRLIGKREGTNVRRRFDGVSAQGKLDDGSVWQLYHGYQVKNATGVFDDSADWNMQVSGMQWQHAAGLVHAMHYDDSREMNTESRSAIEAEQRFNVAAATAFLHGIYQTGELRGQRVAAVFAQAALMWPHQQFEYGVTASYASGGTARHNREFYSPFAKAPYYSEAGIFATTNLQHMGLKLTSSAFHPVTVNVEFKRLFLVNKQGAVYGQGRRVLIQPNASKATPFSDTLDVVLGYPVSPQLKLEWIGSYIRPRRTVELPASFFMETVLHYRF